MPIGNREPGIYLSLGHREYLACPELSASLAHVLLSRSPRHARTPDEDEPSEAQLQGSLLHRLLLGVGETIAVIEADSYRTNRAKDEREAAHARGALPVLAAAYEKAERVIVGVRASIAEEGIDLAPFAREASLFWRAEPGVDCRGRLDLLDLAAGRILDPKFVRNARAFPRSIVPMGYDVQHAAYVQAVEALRPELAGRVRMQFLAIEPYPPFAVARVPLDGSLRSLGELKWKRACALWAECLSSGSWPSYGVIEAAAKPWDLAEEMGAALDAGDPDWMNLA